MFIWVSCGSWVVGNTTVLQETRFHYAIFGEGIERYDVIPIK